MCVWTCFFVLASFTTSEEWALGNYNYDYFLEQGKDYFKKENFLSAENHLLGALKRAKSNLEKSLALYWLGKTLFFKNDFPKATSYLAKVLRHNKRPPLEFLFYYGISLYEIGKYDDALITLTNLDNQAHLREDFDLAEIKQALALIALKKNDYSLAKRYLEAIPKERFSDLTNIPFLLAYTNYLTGDNEKALTILLSYLPTDRELKSKSELLIGTIYLEMKNYVHAASVFESVLRDSVEPYFSEARLRAGLTYFKKGDNYNARRHLDKVNNDYGLFYLSKTFENLRNRKEAIKSYGNLITQFPKSKFKEEAVFNRARLYYDLGDFVQSAQEFKNFRTLFPKTSSRYETVLYYEAKSNFALGKYSFTQQSLIELLKNFPKSSFQSEANLILGKIEFHNKRYNRALTYFKRINPGDEFYYRAQEGIGDCLYKQGKYDLAIESYNRALVASGLDLNKDSINFKVELSNFRLGRYSSYFDMVKEYLEKYPASILNPKLSYELGIHYYQANQYDSAMISLQNRLNSLKSDSLLYRNSLSILGEIFSKDLVARYDSAIGLYKRIVDEFPKSPLAETALYKLAKIYLKLNKPLEAIAVLNLLLSRYPKSSLVKDGLILLTEIYLSQAENNKAEKSLKEYQKQFGESGLFYSLSAEIERNRKKLNRVQEFYIKALNLYKLEKNYRKAIETYITLAEILIELGNSKEAKEYLQTGLKFIEDLELKKAAPDVPLEDLRAKIEKLLGS